ncbi:MAG: hypothetical protein KF691_12175 [Phycisphaeraceae bacterium]|nr:hypothetical protein [Phycisphaeraceae bacterium]
MSRNPVVWSAIAAAALAGSARAVVFFDGIFNNSDWTLTTVTNANGLGSTTNGLQIPVGGNPNQYRRIRNTLNASGPLAAVIGLHMRGTFSYNPGAQAIASINYSEDSINFINQPGNGQGSGLVIFQGGTYYIQRTPILVMPYATYNTWQSNSAPGLLAGDFWELTNTGNLISSSNPDFSTSGGIMQFGFWRGNSGNSSIQTDCGIDNWRVEIIPVPAPAGAGALAMAGLIACQRRRCTP